MKKLNIYYSKEFYNEYGKYAIMDPGTVKLGDIIDYKHFEVVGSLSDLGIEFTEKVKNDNPVAEPIYKSKDIRMGDLSAEAKDIVRFGVRFSSDHSLFLSTKGSKIVSIAEDNLGKKNLGKQIISKFEQGKWEKDWIVVTELEFAQKAIIILSNGKNAEIELKTDGGQPLAVGEVIKANLSFGSESSIGFRYIMPEGDYRSVLFKAKAIDKSFFGKPKFTPRKFMPPVDADMFGGEMSEEYLKEFVWEDYIP